MHRAPFLELFPLRVEMYAPLVISRGLHLSRATMRLYLPRSYIEPCKSELKVTKYDRKIYSSGHNREHKIRSQESKRNMLWVSGQWS